jgi:hypothetical protein
MSEWQYGGNGSNLTRAEFGAHMSRIDSTLQSMDERLGGIEERLERPRRLFFGALGATAGRVVLIVTTVSITWAAAHFGIPVF